LNIFDVIECSSPPPIAKTYAAQRPYRLLTIVELLALINFNW